MSRKQDDPTYSIHDLAQHTDLAIRTVRYYVQIGLVDRPEGETRAARYSQRQLDQLVQIKRWTQAGVSLDRIRQMLQGDEGELPPPKRQPGTIEVRTHVVINDGIDVVIDPSRAGLGTDQMRELLKKILQAYEDVRGLDSSEIKV